jgi:hypothetical protein
MSKLAEKIRLARQIKVEAGDWAFIVTRPTDLDMQDMRKTLPTNRDLLSKFVINWEGIKESDLYDGGTAELVPFDKEVYEEFIADHPELWSGLVNAIVDGYKVHEQKVADSLKN